MTDEQRQELEQADQIAQLRRQLREEVIDANNGALLNIKQTHEADLDAALAAFNLLKDQARQRNIDALGRVHKRLTIALGLIREAGGETPEATIAALEALVDGAAIYRAAEHQRQLEAGEIAKKEPPEAPTDEPTD